MPNRKQTDLKDEDQKQTQGKEVITRNIGGKNKLGEEAEDKQLK